jgi:phosphoglycerol transferase MdoB-like AlkP superfamily enzyme
MTRTVSAIVGRHNARGLEVTLKPGEYPLMHATKPATRAATGTEPRDVFVVLVESFNANAVEARADNGKEYTPFFNSLIPSGLYIERFYGNSVQTAKGHFATFCSLLPSMKSREFVAYADKDLDCLPDVLSRFDYETIFFQTYRNINYDNTRQFLTRNGFDQVESIESHWHKSDRQHSWGWGLQDDLFYRRFFEYYDATLATEVADRPLFVALAPISNHMRFDRVPRKERKMYGNPTKPEQYFANSVNVADRGLKAFFQELRRRKRFANAIVIITGDHSFPVGEHGFYHNETNAYDESFRVPFLMIAPGLVSPERVRDVPYSQLDIAPTIIDATGVHPDRTHFMGRSILEQPRTVAPVYLVQPYAGRYLGVVEYPLKYVLNLQTGQQRLFNLTSDPRELTNLDGKRELVATESHLKSLLRTHFLVKNALEQNQVWN